VVDLVKSLGIIKVYRVSIVAVEEITENLVDVVEKLG